ncbi:MAG TPA: hypothetical protein O0X25_04085 [Methanocorpusculum sp.]|nr:hypothetical protein [Methanocorpusculum sp.]HJJ49778.1 hypothetical protein [Methanocorpusculum sp.]HJJ57384.1 hypothetical protein [Methanocorpusculum sp.]
MPPLTVRNLMNQHIALRRFVFSAEESPYHEKQYTAFHTYPARVEISHGVAYGKNGEMLSSYATIYTTAEVSAGDEIALPDGTRRFVLSVEKAVDGDGQFSHSVVKV